MLILCFKGSFQSLGLTTNGQVYTELFLPLRISRPDFRKLVTFSNSSSWPQISHQQHTIGKSIARSSDKFKRGKRAVPPPRGVLLCGRHHLLPGEKEKNLRSRNLFDSQDWLSLFLAAAVSQTLLLATWARWRACQKTCAWKHFGLACLDQDARSPIVPLDKPILE